MADQLTGRDVRGAGDYSAARAAVCWCDGLVRRVQRCGAVWWPEGQARGRSDGQPAFQISALWIGPAHPAGIGGRSTRQQQGGPGDRFHDPCRPGRRAAPVCWRCRALLLRTRGSLPATEIRDCRGFRWCLAVLGTSPAAWQAHALIRFCMCRGADRRV
jgi:hypothetical protein